MTKRSAIPFLTVIFLTVAAAAGLAAQERAIEFPDVDGYLTLAVDLHTHSVFSDGMVWPLIRVQESNRDGLALLAVTEHLEYQPRRLDIPHPDRNRSFVVASEAASDSGLLVVNGVEITRRMPPGHVNAVFISDANPLLVDHGEDGVDEDEAAESIAEANRQGAFVFWNHPNWPRQRPDGVARLTDMHRRLIADGQLHGIEVANGHYYSAEALQIALDFNLAILGVSDIHGLIDWEYDVHAGEHRTVTLVLAEERSVDAIRDALFVRRTAAWMGNWLIGREEVVLPLIEASLRLTSAEVRGGYELIDITLENDSDADFELRVRSGHRFNGPPDTFRVPSRGTVDLGITGEPRSSFELAFEVLNAVTAPETHPVVRYQIEVERTPEP